jgi:hypothetical protein
MSEKPIEPPVWLIPSPLLSQREVVSLGDGEQIREYLKEVVEATGRARVIKLSIEGRSFDGIEYLD